MADYYQRYFQEYNQKTYYVDPTSFLEPLISQLKSSARILDVGCGSGRDLVWLQKRNYRVTGFERSPGLAGLARKHAGCEIIQDDFETYDFRPHGFDALLMCGSLVHIAHERLPKVMVNILNGLKTDGIVLISLKQGQGVYRQADGRIYYLWSDDILREIFRTVGLVVRTFSQSVSKVNARDMWLTYVLQKK